MGCRGKAPRADLLRVVADGALLVPDPSRVLPGRGASLHHDPACLELAERRRAFPRALRRPGPLDVDGVRAHLRQAAHPDTESRSTSR